MAGAALLLTLPASAIDVERDGQRWVCERLDSSGECLGKTVVVDADGHSFSSTRVPAASGKPRWTGPLSENWPDGSRRQCAGSSPTKGLCVGAIVDTTADGGTVTGTREIRGETSVWTGTIDTLFASGSRERCAAAGLIQPLCNGATEFVFANGNRRQGSKQIVDGLEVWRGPVVETLIDGRTLRCQRVQVNGSCDGEARWLLQDGSERSTRFADGRELVDEPSIDQ